MRPRPLFHLASGAIRVAGHALAALLILVAASAHAAQVISGNGSSVRIEVNRGSLIRLDRPAATVFVADPEICDIQVKSPSLVYLLGKKPGQTTLYAVDAGEKVLANVDITVTHNLSRLNSAVRALYPDADVNISSVEDAVVIDGLVGNATASENVRRLAKNFIGKEGDIINRLGVAAPTQVNLRVRVAEINRSVEKQLGFNWSFLTSVAGTGIAFATFNPFAANSIRDQLGLDFGVGSTDFNVIIDALENEGLISVLAEPNLTAMTGETASFLAGGEFPILVPQDFNRVTIEFKPFGVSLAFTPTIIGGDRINLHVRPEVSELSSEGAITVPLGNAALSVPALTVRRAETTVELGSGQSFAIAGLLSNGSTHDIRKFPGLGELPILGALFKSDRFQRNESELVIIVTPYIVRPSPTHVAAPTDGFSTPNDLERLFGGANHKRNPVKGSASTVAPDGTRLSGPVGFVLE